MAEISSQAQDQRGLGLISQAATPAMLSTHHLFISYASADETAALSLVRNIEQRGLACWISKRDVRPGTDYQAEIVSAIESASYILLILSPRSNASREIPKEMAIASARRKSVIPVRLEDVWPDGALAYQFTNAQFVDLFRDYDANLDKLCVHVGREIAASEAVQQGVRKAWWGRFVKQWVIPATVASIIFASGLFVLSFLPFSGTAPASFWPAATPSARPALAAVVAPSPPPSASPAEPMLSPPPPDTVQPAWPQGASQTIAVQYYAALSGNEQTAIAFIDTHAASSVRFYGQILSKGRFMAAERRHLMKWPHRSFDVDQASITVRCANAVCTVSGMVRYVLQNDTGATSGSERFTINAAQHGGALMLTGLDGKSEGGVPHENAQP